MSNVRIRLDLSRTCIETEIRKRYNRTLSRLLRPCADPSELEAQLVLLQTALETFDFGSLRTAYPELRGNCIDVVELEWADQGRPQVCINGLPVSPGPGRKRS